MNKAIIYLRTSTKEQNPELQKEDCINFCKNHNWEIVGIYTEQVSAFKKDVKREQRDIVVEKARLGEAQHIVVWAFDRWVRNRDTLVEDIASLINYGCQLHSVKDAWLESVNIEGPLGKTIREFLLGLVGSLAEMESSRRSERIFLGKQRTKKKQGRKPLKLDTELILELHNKGLSTYKIAAEYNQLHKPHVSHMTIYNIIKKYKGGKK
jgi:DNA invertase Pin-like site-specific DNA recombinase